MSRLLKAAISACACFSDGFAPAGQRNLLRKPMKITKSAIPAAISAAVFECIGGLWHSAMV